MQKHLWTFLVILTTYYYNVVSGDYLMGGHLDNNARENKSRSGKITSSSILGHKAHVDDLDLDFVQVEESTTVAATVSTLIGDDVPRYRIPYHLPFAFNGGKPFSLEKDPITGMIDFEKAPPVRALNYTNHYQKHQSEENDNTFQDNNNSKQDSYFKQEKMKNKQDNDDRIDPNEINIYTPNFHDFLNLPIHYSSDKYGNDKYPLISSSYANTKVQSGANSYSIYNHRPYHQETELYAHPPTISYSDPLAKILRPTIINDPKIKWTNIVNSSTTIAAASPSQTNVPITTTTSKEPIITTWKPSAAAAVNPITFRHPTEQNSVITDKENRQHLLLEGSMKNSTFENLNISAHFPNDEITEKIQAVIPYKEHHQPTLNNFVVLSHIGSETKLSMQNEEYKDSYDIQYEPPSSSDNENDSEENDYFLPFGDIFQNDTTKSSMSFNGVYSNISTEMSTDISNVTLSSSTSTSSITTTIIPPVSTLPIVQKDILTTTTTTTTSNTTTHFPVTSQFTSLFFNINQRPNAAVTERYENMINHNDDEHKPTQIIKSGHQLIDGSGIVIESTSNIVIPPDQDSVSFVLGNHQNVDADYYSIGTATEDNNSYDSLSDTYSLESFHNNMHGSIKQVMQHKQPYVTDSNVDHIIQKWWPPPPPPPSSPSSSNILISNNKVEILKSQNPFISTTSSSSSSDAILQSTIRQNNNKNSTYVTFPSTDAEKNNGEETKKHYLIAANDQADSDIGKLPFKTMIPITATKNKTKINFPMGSNDGSVNLPQLAANLVPPAKNLGQTPPLYYYNNYQSDTLKLDHPRPQRLPLRGKPYSGLSLSSLDVGGLKRRPYTSDIKLPNILPQFRPNAKASHGHRGSDVIGTIPAGQNLSTRIRQPFTQNQPAQSSRRPFPPPPPSYLQRLNPPPPPIHAVRLAFVPSSKMDSGVTPLLHHETEPIIPRFRLPESIISRGNLEGNTTTLHTNRLLEYQIATENKSKNEERNKKEQDRDKNETAELEKYSKNEKADKYPEEPPMTPPRPPLFPKRRTADPPHVTTLQMIQHHGGEFGENEEGAAAFFGINQAEETEEALHSSQFVKPILVHETEYKKPDHNYEQPVYVVYPVNTAVNIHPDDSKEKDENVVVGTSRGPHRPLPPDTLLLQDERKKTYTAGKPVVLDFPYPLERPDPSSTFTAAADNLLIKETPLLIPSEQRQDETFIYSANEHQGNTKNEPDNTINVIPYLQDVVPYRKKNTISATLHRTASTSLLSSSMPMIASTLPSTQPISYVYTLPTRMTHPPPHHHPLDDISASIDTTTTTVLLSSQQSSSSSDSQLPAPQNFMAPFVASISAEEAPTKNGWNVVVVEPHSTTNKRIDGDSDEIKAVSSEFEIQTEKDEFDADNFKPQLFGGFKPIYEFPTENTEHRTLANINAEINTS